MTASLFNRYRPQRFSDLVGQDAVAAALRGAVAAGRIAPAYLFSGPQGTGKTSAARVLARAVNCQRLDEGEPCGHCTECDSGSPDIVEMDAASNRGIDEIRALRASVQIPPLGGGRRVYILDEAHQITGDAFNALLKTLEEPPAHVLFILATTEPAKVPGTIQSRCQHFAFRRVPSALLVPYLAKIAGTEGIRAANPALELIVRASRGGVRDAIQLLEQASILGGEEIHAEQVRAMLGAVGETALRPLLASFVAGDLPAVFTALSALAEQGADGASALSELTEMVRSDFSAAVRAGDSAATRKLFPLLDELARAAELQTGDETTAYVPLMLALYRAGDPGIAGTPAGGRASGAAAPPATTAARPAAAAPVSARTPAATALRPAAPSGATPAPAAPSRPATAQAAEVRPLDLERVRAAWRRLPEVLRTAKMAAAADMVASSIFPAEVRGDSVVLDTDSSFAATWLKDRTRQETLGKALSKELGMKVRVLAKAGPGARPEPAGSRTGSEHDRTAARFARFFEAEEA